MTQLAFFIDAIGLDIFLILLGIQFLTLPCMFFNMKIKPEFSYIITLFSRHLLVSSWKNIREKPEELVLTAPSPAALMHTIVFLVAISMMFNIH